MDYDKLMESFLKKDYNKADSENIFDKSKSYRNQIADLSSSSEEYNKIAPPKVARKVSTRVLSVSSSSDSIMSSNDLSSEDISMGEKFPLKSESSDASVSDIEMHDMIENMNKRVKSVNTKQITLDDFEKGMEVIEDCKIKPNDDEDDTNLLNIQIPPFHAKSGETITLSINMDDKFKNIFKRIEKTHNVKIITRKFDGEVIKDTDTARTIELFPDDLLDLVYE